MSEAGLIAAAERDAAGLDGTLERLVADGHALALRVDDVDEDVRQDAAALRRAVAERARAVQALLAAHGVPGAAAPSLWRPPLTRATLETVGRAASVDRPAVLWSRHVADGAADAIAAAATRQLSDGDIVALPGGGVDCAVVDAVPRLADALAAAGLSTVTVPALLGPQITPRAAVQVVRYRGPGLAPRCRRALGLGDDAAEAEGDADRWGVVHRALPDGGVEVVPLPGVAGDTAELFGGAAAALASVAARRVDFEGLGGCLRSVPAARLDAPVTPTAGGRRAAWWVVGAEGVTRRDARALEPPGHAVVLPTVHDLVRVEARQRLPWSLRGVVAGALGGLGLEAPLLVEARSTVGVLVARPLTPAQLDDAAALRAAVGGFVQLGEISLGEYLFLRAWSPRDTPRLETAARAADGFVRAGPWLALPMGPGAGPDPARLGPDGRAAFDRPPEAVLAGVLRAGGRLAPGDVVAVAARPVRGAPRAEAPRDAPSRRSAMRQALARSITRGLVAPHYLRPGGVVEVDGDVLGRQTLRIAVPPGVAVPTFDAAPLVEVQPPAAEGAR
ncbi:MAG: hypothetical protein H6704_21765 [Myxococcales bacterium]|nr:hypothetical protein [Myxococcales bacterium]